VSVHSGRTLLLIGVSHRSTSLAEREALALSLDERMSLQRDWCRSGEADECFVLTTCNRSEFYVVSGDPPRAEATLRRALARLRGWDALGSVTHRYRRLNREASRHLLRVAAGLDSMVLGDVQILGQVRDAYQAARQANAIGPALHRLVQRALCTGRRARAETRIATGNASMPSAVISLLRAELGTLADRDIAVIGAGETGRLLATNAMTDRGVRLTVINRSLARAARLAEEVGARAAALDALPDVLAQADAVVCATAAPGTVISTADVGRAMARRGGRPLLLVDLAVPRDVDPHAARVAGVTLHTVDAVQRVVDGTRIRRAAEIPAVESIVDQELTRLEICGARARTAVLPSAVYDSPRVAVLSV